MKKTIIPAAIVAAVIQAGREADLEVLSARDLFDVYLSWHGIIGFTDDLWELSHRLHTAETSGRIQSLSLPGTVAPLEDRCGEVIVDTIIASGPQPIDALIHACRHEIADYSPGYALRAIRQLTELREVEFANGRYDLTTNDPRD